MTTTDRHINSEDERTVLQVIPTISEDWGGPAVGSMHLRSALERLGVNAKLLAARYPVGATVPKSSTQVEVYPSSRPHVLENSWKLGLRILAVARTTDWIHIHGQYRLPTVYAYIAARLTATPYGLQPHGSMEPYQRAQSKVSKYVFDILVGKRIIRDASYVMFASESERDNASDLVRDDQAFVNPLGAALSSTTAVAGLDRFYDGVPRNQSVLFLGRLAAKKRPDLLVRAWQQAFTEQARLCIAGPDSDFSAQALGDLLPNPELRKSMATPGSVNIEEKSWLFEKCGIFVLPSQNENFGLTVAEAMLAGCHVITTRATAASFHLIEAGCGEVLEDPHQDDIAAALTRAFQNPEMVLESGARARAYAEANLTWSATAGRLRERWSTNPSLATSSRRRVLSTGTSTCPNSQ
nr:glycosyltransferase [Rhodococcus ruber]